MAKFYSTLDKFKRRDRKEVMTSLTSLDIAILERTKTGADYFEIVNACKPYKGRTGIKFFASSIKIKSRIKELKKKDLLEIG